MRARVAVACATLALTALAAGVFDPPARGASTTIQFAVTSATNLSLTGCPMGARTIGTILPGVPGISGTDCTVQFGSSNDVSRLRLLQSDHSTTAMFTWTTGAKDTGFNAAPAGYREVAPPGGGSGADGAWYGGGTLDVASDGDVLKGGTTSTGMQVGRWSASGSLETATWGGGDGWALMNASVDAPTSTATTAGDVLALRSGRVAVGAIASMPGNDRVVVARFDTAGLLDGTFGGGDGIVSFLVDPADSVDSATIAEQPDGSIVVAGRTTGSAFYAARVTTTGVLDMTFGGGDGVWRHVPGGAPDAAVPLVLGDGGILVVGASGDDPYAAKLTRHGSLDTSFGAGAGWVRPAPPGGTAARNGGFVDAQGNIYILGSPAFGGDVSITRLTSTGALDTVWAPNGTVTHNLGSGTEFGDFGETLVRPDGSYCTGGDYDNSGWKYWVGCFLPSGAKDTSFGTGGVVEFSGVAGIESGGGGIAAANGRIYAGAGSGTFAIMAIGSDVQTVPDYAHPGTNFASAGGAFGACLRTSSNATPTWTPAPGANCSGDGSHWNGIAKVATDPSVEVAAAAANVTTAEATLRFGLRTPGTSKGAFVAPMTFEVLAP